jgi:hypothetical protein
MDQDRVQGTKKQGLGSAKETLCKVTGIAEQSPDADRTMREPVLRQTVFYLFVPTTGARL